MTNRLSSVDVSYLYLEESATMMNVGSVLVLRPPKSDWDVEGVIEHIGRRIAYAPRYRQRLKWVPARLANPLWVDDVRFDLRNHVFRTALPQPGTDQQLCDLVARLISRPLDRARPLWEVWVVEGLVGDRIALITKCHQALVDGVNALELSHVVLDPQAQPAQQAPVPPDSWHPDREPSLLEMVSGAVVDTVQRPSQVVDTVRSGLVNLRASTIGSAVSSVWSVVGHARPAPESPLNVDVGHDRRFAILDTALDDYRAIRSYYLRGGRASRAAEDAGFQRISVNDVVLATLAGGLREWLLTRGARVTAATTIRALVPMSVQDRAEPAGVSGEQAGRGEEAGFGSVPAGDLEAFLVDLPVGEPNPVLRLQQVAFQTRAHTETGRGVPARALAEIGGFGPATVHSVAARLASRASKRVFNLVVTNVPGPQRPLYAAGARLERGYPVLPLMRGQGLAVGLTSYNGGVYYGFNADRDGLPDLEVLVDCVASALQQLRDTVVSQPPRSDRKRP